LPIRIGSPVIYLLWSWKPMSRKSPRKIPGRIGPQKTTVP
jgi:hypothetical protein